MLYCQRCGYQEFGTTAHACSWCGSYATTYLPPNTPVLSSAVVPPYQKRSVLERRLQRPPRTR